jgi:hypothetical protein
MPATQPSESWRFRLPHLNVVMHAHGHVLEHVGGQGEVAPEEDLVLALLCQSPRHVRSRDALAKPTVQVRQPQGPGIIVRITLWTILAILTGFDRFFAILTECKLF